MPVVNSARKRASPACTASTSTMYVAVCPGGSVSSGVNVTRPPSTRYVAGPEAVTARICGGTVAATATRSPGSEPVFFT